MEGMVSQYITSAKNAVCSCSTSGQCPGDGKKMNKAGWEEQ